MSTVPPARNFPPPRVGALLTMAWENLYGELFDAVRDAGFDDLREVHRPMMRYPPIDGLRPSQLAERLNLSKQAVNDLLRDFEAMALVRLERDPIDGRARIIRFTDRGWDCYEAASAASRQIGERWAEQIGDKKYRAFIDGLEAILGLDKPQST